MTIYISQRRYTAQRPLLVGEVAFAVQHAHCHETISDALSGEGDRSVLTKLSWRACLSHDRCQKGKIICDPVLKLRKPGAPRYSGFRGRGWGQNSRLGSEPLTPRKKFVIFLEPSLKPVTISSPWCEVLSDCRWREA